MSSSFTVCSMNPMSRQNGGNSETFKYSKEYRNTNCFHFKSKQLQEQSASIENLALAKFESKQRKSLRKIVKARKETYIYKMLQRIPHTYLDK